MSIFGKPASQITAQDLTALLTERASENVRLEYKREIPNRDELLKKLSSFSNTFGGYLVIGAAAGSADGRIANLHGVAEQSGFRQTVMQWTFEGTSPPITVEVSDPIPAPEGDGTVCYVLKVEESELAPHFLNGRKGLYVRTDEFSSHFKPQLATENELRHLLQRRQPIRDRRVHLIERARARLKAFTSRPAEVQEFRPEQMDARFDLAVIPRFPVAPLCDHLTLLKITRETSISWRSTGFPRNTHSAISQHESAIILDPAGPRSFYEASIWGLSYYSIPLGERSSNYSGIHTPAFLGALLAFLKHCRQLFQTTGCAGQLHIEVRLDDILTVPWISFPNGYAETGACCELDNTVTFALESSTEELNDSSQELARKLLQTVFFAINWPGAADDTEKLTALILAGRKYNSWQ